MIRKLYNPTASKDNLLVMHQSQTGCCGSDLKICQYTSANMATLSVTAITLTIDGVNTAFTFAETANTSAKLEAQLLLALGKAGYDIVQKGDVVVGMSGSNYYVELLGEAVAVSLTNSGSPVAFTAKCTKVVVCEHTITTGTLTSITLNGEETELGEDSLTYGDEDVDTTDVVAAIVDAFDGDAAIIGVAATDDVVNEKWVITIKALQGTKIRINGFALYPMNCGPFYQA